MNDYLLLIVIGFLDIPSIPIDVHNYYEARRKFNHKST